MKYKKLLQKLSNLRFVKDDPLHHKEESVLHHSLQAYKIARKESDCKELWVASLLHDIGKLIDNHSHEAYSLDILEAHGYYNPRIYELIKLHMVIRWFLSGRVKKWGKVQKIINHEYLKDLIHLRRIDASSRVHGKSIDFDAEEINQLLLDTESLK